MRPLNRGVYMDLKPIAKNYFETFSKKDSQGLKNLFSEDVSLRDWEIQANGKKDVLAANQKIFDGVKSIQVNPVSMYQEGNTVLSELEILIDQTTKLLVLDIIDFDTNHKIKAVRAFKGN